MNARQRLDKIMISCCAKIQEETSVLLGKKLKLAAPETHLLSRGDFFSRHTGSFVFAHVQLEGDLEGKGGILLSVADAIRIGGTLIMLPASELTASIAAEDYTEELQDSYGEIANIFCGSMTSILEEEYPSAVRLIRKEQEVIVPARIPAESSGPIDDRVYYTMQTSLSMGEEEMGELLVLLPGESFGLADEDVEMGGQAERENAAEAAKVQASPGEDEPREEAQAAGKISPVNDPRTEKKKIDRLLDNCMGKAAQDVGALLGGHLEVITDQGRILTKKVLFEQLNSKQVMARMDARGDAAGEGFLFSGIADAIVLGGTLIMLPLAAIDETIAAEELTADLEDSYGEIANIVVGAITSVFEEESRRSIGFVKKGLETIVPSEVDCASDEVIPDGHYYVSSSRMRFNDAELGMMHAVFPLALLALDGLSETSLSTDEDSGHGDTSRQAPGIEEQPTPAAQERRENGIGQVVDGVDSGDSAAADVLIVTDDDPGAEHIAALLDHLGFAARILHYKDAVKAYRSYGSRLVFLVMQEVNEQGFAVAIKISSGGAGVPLVAVGPSWTRSLVLQAVKYGADDILVAPVSEEDLRESITANLAKIAA